MLLFIFIIWYYQCEIESVHSAFVNKHVPVLNIIGKK